MLPKSLYISFVCFLAVAIGCNPSSPDSRDGMAKKIRVIPLGINGNDVLLVDVTNRIKNVFPEVRVLAERDLPEFAYYKNRNRYRADSLIRWMESLAAKDEVYIGITNKDISTSKGEHADWGVMGLGYCPGHACIASSCRLKNKSMLWKVAIHEMGHTAGLPHCKNTSCFMRDAEGGDPTAEEKYFCNSCRAFLIDKGWKLQ